MPTLLSAVTLSISSCHDACKSGRDVRPNDSAGTGLELPSECQTFQHILLITPLHSC